jgi:hypothetical protein
LSWLAEDPQKLQRCTDKTERSGRHRKAEHEPNEQRQAQEDEQNGHAQLGEQIVHGQQ